jgi:hypothetical protein
MLRIDKDNLEILVCCILVYPVRVQHSQIGAFTTNTLFSCGTQRTLVFKLIDSLVCGFSVGCTFGDGTFSASSTDTNAVDDIALFGLVAKTTGLVGARGTGGAVDYVELAVFPAADAEKESEDIGLFVLVELCGLDVVQFKQ